MLIQDKQNKKNEVWGFFPLSVVYVTHGVLKKARGNLEVGSHKQLSF